METGNKYTMDVTIVGEKIYNALNNPAVKIILLPGGTRSSKTFSIMQNIFLYMLSGCNRRVTAWRAYQTWIRFSILYDWKNKFLNQCGLSGQLNSTITPPVYVAKKTLSTLEFAGLDEPQKLQGVASDLIWINEAIEAKQESVRQLLQRATGKIILDYNPSEEEHWVYDLAKRPDSIIIHSTYKDNPFLPDTTVREIEAYEPTVENIKNGTASEYHWQVYGLGLAAKKEGLIYPKWEIIDEYPSEAKMLGYGLDFGFYPDPSAFGRVGLMNGRIVLDELFYENGLNNIIVSGREDVPSIQGRLNELGITRRDSIISDSAGKSNISELNTAGFSVEGVKKYAGSVIDGIELMKKYMPFYVTSKSVNTIRELKNYTYRKNHATNLFLSEPIDGFNHLLDLYRYVVQTKISVPKNNGIKKISF